MLLKFVAMFASYWIDVKNVALITRKIATYIYVWKCYERVADALCKGFCHPAACCIILVETFKFDR